MHSNKHQHNTSGYSMSVWDGVLLLYLLVPWCYICLYSIEMVQNISTLHCFMLKMDDAILKSESA